MPNLRLHDVDDAQRFVCAVVNKSGLTLSWSDREDLEQFLLETAYLLSLRYEPSAGSFSNYAYVRLRQRAIDWQRKRFGRRTWKFSGGRTYERQLPELVSLDTERDSIGEALGTIGGDSAAVWDEACRGLFAERDRERVRDLDALRLDAA